MTTVAVFTPLHAHSTEMASSDAPYQAVLSPDLLAKFKHLNEDSESINSEVSDDTQIVGPNSDANIMVLSTLLVLGLTTNLLAFPVIMFRRTKFGNGQFAVLLLCLTVSDLLTVCCGLMGGLVLEVGHMSWAGSTISCSIYYFLTSWVLGLTNYLITALIGLVHVKRSTSWLSRLQECWPLLLVLTVITLLPSLPELVVRSTIHLDPTTSVCIISISSIPYGLYYIFKMVITQIIPIAVVSLSLVKPKTKVAKRFSSIFLGDGATCECGPSGQELSIPHQCPKIGRKPDVVTSHKEGDRKETMVTITKGKKSTKCIAVREDPHRRTYKSALATVFLSCSLLQLMLDLSLQVQSVSVSQWEEVEQGANLATALLLPTYLKQIINPLILLYTEFLLESSGV